jgi:hypothetical protein
LCTPFIITSVGGDGTAKGYYANDAYGPWRVRAGCHAFPHENQQEAGRVDAGELRLSLGTFASTKYLLDSTGTALSATYVSGGNTTLGKMHKEQ